MQPERKTYRKICQQCGREFLAYQSRTACCSDRCAKLLLKHQNRDERLKKTSIEVREIQRLALLDKNFLTISDAAKLLQLSRNTLYKIIEMHSIQLHRFTDRTIRISRTDLEKVGHSNASLVNTTIAIKEDILTNWMTREQVLEEFEVKYVTFYANIKKHNPKVKMIHGKAFYDKQDMEKLFFHNQHPGIKEWYTFKELMESTGMKLESICEYCANHKIPRKRKDGLTYVSKLHWNSARGESLDPAKHITIKEIMETYKLSRTHLFTILRDNGLEKIKKGNFVYFQREEVAKALKYREEKLKQL